MSSLGTSCASPQRSSSSRHCPGWPRPDRVLDLAQADHLLDPEEHTFLGARTVYFHMIMAMQIAMEAVDGVGGICLPGLKDPGSAELETDEGTWRGVPFRQALSVGVLVDGTCGSGRVCPAVSSVMRKMLK